MKQNHSLIFHIIFSFCILEYQHGHYKTAFQETYSGNLFCASITSIYMYYIKNK